MQLNTGNPSLISATRFKVNDPSTAARPQWTDQEVKDAINLAYLSTVNEILIASPGYFWTRDFFDTTQGQTSIPLPSDWVRMIQVVVEESGKNLETDDQADGREYGKVSWNQLQNEKRKGSPARLWSVRPENTTATGTIEIFPKVAQAGTKASWLVYEFEPTALVNDTDEPRFPATHHEIIAVRAAIQLKESRDLSPELLYIAEQRLSDRLMNTITDWDIGDTPQFGSLALASKYRPASNAGQVK